MFKSLPKIKIIYDHKTLLSMYWSCQPSNKPILFPWTFLFPSGTSSSSPLHNPFQVVSLCDPGYCWILCFSFCCPPIGQSCRQYFIVSLWFPHISCWLFLDIECLWVSQVCPRHNLLSLTSFTIYFKNTKMLINVVYTHIQTNKNQIMKLVVQQLLKNINPKMPSIKNSLHLK